MGSAIPASVGAASYRSDQVVVALLGDGGYHESSNELGALRSIAAKKVIVVVLNNAKLGRIEGELKKPLGTALPNPDFVKIAQSWGFHGVRVNDDSPAAISSAIDECFATPGVSIVDLVEHPELYAKMWKEPRLIGADMLKEAYASVDISRLAPELKGVVSFTTYSGNGSVTYFGDLLNPLTGQVPDDCKEPLDCASFKHGFQVGSGAGFDSLSDSLAVNGVCYSVSNKPNPKHTSCYSTAFYMVEPADATPDLVIKNTAPVSISLGHLMGWLCENVNYPFFYIAGLATFSKVNSLGINQPPTRGKNLMQREELLAHIKQFPEMKEKTFFLSGIVSDFAANDEFRPANYEKVFPYFEGEEAIGGHYKLGTTSLERDSSKMHFHACGLTKKVSSIDEVKPSIVDHVCHMKPAESIVTDFEFEIYFSNSIKKHGEFAPKKSSGKVVGRLIED